MKTILPSPSCPPPPAWRKWTQPAGLYPIGKKFPYPLAFDSSIEVLPKAIFRTILSLITIPPPLGRDGGVSMYRFESCPFQEKSVSGQIMYLDTNFSKFVICHRDTLQNFCKGKFCLCPYYRIPGIKTRFGGKNLYPKKRIR